MWQTRKDVVVGYRKVIRVKNGRKVFDRLHRLRAEKALGRPLPRGVVVHHADGSTADDAPLVICQDNAYHMLLHRRMRVKAFGGNPSTDAICCFCQKAKSFEAFTKARTTHNGLSSVCRDCKNKYQNENARLKREMARCG